jgi:hypothetical protein
LIYNKNIKIKEENMIEKFKNIFGNKIFDNKIFDTREFKEYYEKHLTLYKVGDFSLPKADKEIRKNFFKYSEGIFAKSKYNEFINNEFRKNDLIDEKSEFSIGSFIDDDNNLTINLLNSTSVDFSLQEREFTLNELKNGKTIDLNEDEEMDIYFLTYKNDLMNDIESLKSFACYGEESDYDSVKEMIKHCQDNDIKIKQLWIGYNY